MAKHPIANKRMPALWAGILSVSHDPPYCTVTVKLGVTVCVNVPEVPVTVTV
jgi:hypothetical protein